MHIPDGYLSPTTCLTLTGVMLPIWYRAAAVMKKNLDVAQVPFMAMAAVFSFLIMMFNIPIPDGTTGHAVGSVLIAILLGPWAAVIATSVALFIQALIFGDGGLLAFGVNAFNMAFIMPFIGWYVYRLAIRVLPDSLGIWQLVLSAGLAGYIALNVGALCAAVEFGIQPILFVSSDGTPLYCPYPLSVSIPAMMGAHLLVAGFVEGLVTALAVKFVWKSSPHLVHMNLSDTNREEL